MKNIQQRLEPKEAGKYVGPWCSRRSGSNLLEKLLGNLDVINLRNHGGWKHGHCQVDTGLNLVMCKHPWSQIRSLWKWYLGDWAFSIVSAVKKPVMRVSRQAKFFAYAPMLDSYFMRYAYWFEALESFHLVRYEDFLRNPQSQFDEICDYLGEERVSISLPEHRVSPQDNGPVVIGESFDPSFYLDYRWLDWFTESEIDFLRWYVRKHDFDEIMACLGYDENIHQNLNVNR